MKKALILSCSTGQGHNSCARAVKEYFDRKQVDCTVVDAFRFVSEKFAVFMGDWKLLPMNERMRISSQMSDEEIAEVICEYIAGMTDIAAIEEHRKLFDPHTRF